MIGLPGVPLKRYRLGVYLRKYPLADNCMTADAYATAFMAMGREKAKLLKEKTPGIEYFIIYADKKGKFCTEYSKGFTQYLFE